MNIIRIDQEIKKKYNNITILRPTMIYGRNDINISKLIKFMKKFKFFPIFGSGKNFMQPIYVEDLSESYFSVIKFKKKTFNKSYNLPGKKPIRYIDLLKTIEKKLNEKIYFFNLPILLSIFLVKIFQIVFFGKIPVNTSQVKRLTEDKTFDYTGARKDFSFNPRSFEEGIEIQINNYIK